MKKIIVLLLLSYNCFSQAALATLQTTANTSLGKIKLNLDTLVSSAAVTVTLTSSNTASVYAAAGVIGQDTMVTKCLKFKLPYKGNWTLVSASAVLTNSVASQNFDMYLFNSAFSAGNDRDIFGPTDVNAATFQTALRFGTAISTFSTNISFAEATIADVTVNVSGKVTMVTTDSNGYVYGILVSRGVFTPVVNQKWIIKLNFRK